MVLLCLFYKAGSQVVQDVLEVLVLLPPPPERWDEKCAHPHPVYTGLGMEPEALCLLGKRSAI